MKTKSSKFFSILISVILLLTSPKVTRASGFGFLKIAPDPRGYAMGEMGTAISEGLGGLYWNPAGLAKLKHPELTFAYTLWFEDIYSQWTAYAQPTRMGSFALAGNYLGMKKFQGYDNNGNKMSLISAYDFAACVSFAKALWRIPRAGELLYAGLSAKFIEEKLEEITARGFSADLGLIYNLGSHISATSDKQIEGLTLGLSLLNLGQSGKFEKERVDLPTTFKFGLGYSAKPFSRELNSGVDISWVKNREADASIGFEYWLEKSFALRIGYKGVEKPAGGLRAGFGAKISPKTAFLKMEEIQFDYAWAGFNTLGETHKIGLTVQFEKEAKEESSGLSPSSLEKKEYRYRRGRNYFEKNLFNQAILEFIKVQEIDSSDRMAVNTFKEIYQKISSSDTVVLIESTPTVKEIKLLFGEGKDAYSSKNYQLARTKFLLAVIFTPENKEIRKYFKKTVEKLITQEKKNSRRKEKTKPAQESEKPGEKEIENFWSEIKNLEKKGLLLSVNDYLYRILEIDPDNKKALREIKELQGKLEKVLNNRRSLSAKERYSIEGFLNYNEKKFKEAISSFEKALSVEPSGEKYLLEDKILEGYLTKAKKIVSEENVKKQVQQLLKNGISAYRQSKFKEAQQFFLEVTKLESENIKAKEYLTKCEEELEKLKRAKQAEVKPVPEKPAEKVPSQEDIKESEKHYQQGLVYYASGQLESAMKEFEFALRLNPKHEKANQALEKIKKELKLNEQ